MMRSPVEHLESPASAVTGSELLVLSPGRTGPGTARRSPVPTPSRLPPPPPPPMFLVGDQALELRTDTNSAGLAEAFHFTAPPAVRGRLSFYIDSSSGFACRGRHLQRHRHTSDHPLAQAVIVPGGGSVEHRDDCAGQRGQRGALSDRGARACRDEHADPRPLCAVGGGSTETSKARPWPRCR
jgi:hypothetical protein